MYSLDGTFKDVMDHSKRLSVLSIQEQKAIYQIPDFTKEERTLFFSLNSAEKDIVQSVLRGLSSKVFFILQLGYFRSLYQFFIFEFSDVQKDVAYILQAYFPDKSQHDLSITVNKKTRLYHRKIIQTLYSYRSIDIEISQKLLKKSESLLLKDSNPKYIFKELHTYLSKNKIILPSYSTIQDLISRAIINHERRIARVIQEEAHSYFKDKLDNLLHKESEHRYYLTLIKAPQNSFSRTQAIKEREKREVLDDLYLDSKNILEYISISTQSIKYYARLVDQFTIHRLSQLDDCKRYFYLICFIVHRYLRINDALIKTMLFQSHKIYSNVVSRVKEHVSILNVENLRNLKKGSEVLDLLTSTKLSDNDSIGLLRQKAYGVLSKSKISRLSQFLKKSNVDVQELRWLEMDRHMHRIQTNVRHIFKSITFEASSVSNPPSLYLAIQYLQDYLSSNKRKMDNAPLGHVPKAVLNYLYKESPQGNVLDPFRYECFIYKLLKKRLDSFEIFVPDSTEFKSLENDLVSKTFYIQNKHNLHIEYDNAFLIDSVETRVKRKLQELDDLLHVTNDRIIKGENKQFKPLEHSKSKWVVEYQGTENKDINNPVFQKMPKIDLPQLLWLVNNETHFLDAFTHILYKDAKLKPTITHLIGTIIAFATNMGISKFASCSNVSYDTFKATRDTFFREDTLRVANDIIMNATSELPIHELYKIGGTIHSAVDGKKYDAAGHMFNARCSPKYFNLGKGVSILTLLINFMPAALKIISPTEYEGNYGLELLMMNETNIQSVINSTDMHGINDLNFALYDGAGYDFQPRYTNLFEASKQLSSSVNYSPKQTDIICPSHMINEKIIYDEEDNMKRIIVSMLDKRCSVSTIVKKLTSSLKSDRTRKAFAEYNKLLRSIHILKSINRPEYRQNIQKALNRTELYHYLTGEVSYAHKGKIMAKTELDQIIYKECSRLVCNAILYYNSVILSHLYTSFLEKGQHSQIELLKHISPISWVNINLYGTFELKSSFNISFPLASTDAFSSP